MMENRLGLQRRWDLGAKATTGQPSPDFEDDIFSLGPTHLVTQPEL
jgi:hypothetical protein